MVYPSLYEGFGLPPLEAMAAGAPVVTSNTSSIPEVVGDAALMVSPHDVIGLAKIITRVYSDQNLRDWLRKKGFEQVKKYNWPRVARNTLSTYYEVHHSSDKDEKITMIPMSKWEKLLKLSSVRG